MSLWLSGLAVLIMAVGAGISGLAVSWGLTCGLLAVFVNNLTDQPTAGLRPWVRPLRITAGVVALVGAAIAFTANAGAPGTVIGAVGVLIGSAVLVDGLWPASRERYPRLFGGTR